jgi:hypothetical protein
MSNSVTEADKFFEDNYKEEEWSEINRKMKEGSGEETDEKTMSKKGVKQWDAQTQSYVVLGEGMSPKETGEKINEHEQILIEMRKEISALGFTVSQHQSYFELLQKLSEQQKIEIVKN